MKKVIVGLALVLVFSWMIASAAQAWPKFTFGIHRDYDCMDGHYDAPCMFLPIKSPCAVPCRVQGSQPQAVPYFMKTACPSKKLPCYGFAYANNPYPLFR